MQKPLFVLAALCAFTVSAVAADPKYDAFMGRVVGNNTTVSFGTNGTALATSSAGLGTPAIGNMGLSQSGSGVSLAGNVNAPLAGTSKTVPVVARMPITRKAFLAGVGLAASNPLFGVGLAIAAPSLMEWLEGRGVGINPDAPSQPTHPFTLRNYACDSASPPKAPTYTGDGWSHAWVVRVVDSGSCQWGYEYRNADYSWANPYWQPLIWVSRSQSSERYPATLNDILPYMDVPEAPALTPQIVEQAVVKKGINPFGIDEPQVTVSGPSSVPGEKTSTTEPVKLIPGTTTVAPPGTPVTEPGTKTTVKESATKLDYSGPDIKTSTSVVTNTSITNNITNQTINEGDTITETEEKPEIEMCGLPGTPACKIDETGTPKAKEDTAEADAKKALKPLDDLIANPQSALPTLPTINWAFTLPSGCAPIALPAFEPWLQEIDVCAFQPMFHDIMTFVWVLGGIFGAIGTFWRNTFSQG